MSQREWVEKDFYKELGVSSSASADEIKKAYRKLSSQLHPDKNPGNATAEERYKSVTEAKTVLLDPAKRKEYDDTRRMYAGGGGFRSGFQAGTQRGGFNQDFNLGDIFGGSAGDGGLGDILSGVFRGARGGPANNRPKRGSDVETEITLGFREAAQGVTLPLKLTSPAPCTTCHGSGARPGTSPKVCPTCNGVGLVSRNEGAFGFSEPCPDCRGSGSIIENPCTDCSGSGVQNRTRTIPVRIPAGVANNQRIRIAGHGEAGLRGAPSGDLYVTVRVNNDQVFGRKGDDLTIDLPVTFSELTLGTTVSIPTLDGKVGVKIPAGTGDGRVLRVRGKGVKKGDKQGDLLVTVRVQVPHHLDVAATDALKQYHEAEKASGFNPRSGWAGN